MQYERRVRISTPEGVDLDFELAGLGSRFAARLLDLLLMTLVGAAALLAAVALAAGVGAAGELGVAAGGGLAFFAILGYGALFEAFAAGRTPGKRRLGTRVVSASGGPVGFREATIRNAVLLLVELPTAFLPSLVSILRSDRSQRLGDLAAGTIVVRLESDRGLREPIATVAPDPAALAAAGAWDLSAIGDDELLTIRHFLHRRDSLPARPRRRLAGELAARLRPMVVGPGDAEIEPERFLELLAALKASRGGRP